MTGSTWPPARRFTHIDSRDIQTTFVHRPLVRLADIRHSRRVRGNNGVPSCHKPCVTLPPFVFSSCTFTRPCHFRPPSLLLAHCYYNVPFIPCLFTYVWRGIRESTDTSSRTISSVKFCDRHSRCSCGEVNRA